MLVGLGQTIRKNFGVQFNVETSGNLGEFDSGVLLGTLVNALVLLGTIDSFLVITARKVLRRQLKWLNSKFIVT